MTERAVEHTGHQLAAFGPGIFDSDIQIAEADAFIVSFELHGAGSDTVIIFKFQSSAPDAEAVEAFICMLVFVAHLQGCIFLSILELSLDIGRYFELAQLPDDFVQSRRLLRK